MLTLCMDTAYRYLTIALIKDDEIIASFEEECFKKQSEMIFVKLKELFESVSLDPLAIDAVCISEGPGSYTGVRIAMSIAKTLCEVAHKELYTISTLRLYAAGHKNTMVIMDARANRAYVGIYDEDRVIMEDRIMKIEDLEDKGYDLIGDLSLLGLEDKRYSISEAFLQTKGYWHKVDKIAYLVPKYLKEDKEYLR